MASCSEWTITSVSKGITEVLGKKAKFFVRFFSLFNRFLFRFTSSILSVMSRCDKLL
jgi:hypothetical protein